MVLYMFEYSRRIGFSRILSFSLHNDSVDQSTRSFLGFPASDSDRRRDTYALFRCSALVVCSFKYPISFGSQINREGVIKP